MQHVWPRCSSRLTSARQEEELAKWGLCKVCLIAKHPAAECTKGNCPVCKTEKHNSAICPKAKGKRVYVRVDKGDGKQKE